MTDPIERFFDAEREAVPLLAPPSGRFDELKAVARRRRGRNTFAASAAAVAVVAVIGAGAVLGLPGHGSTRTNVASPATATGATPSLAGKAVTPSAGATAPAVDPTVPSGFKVWSVSLFGSNAWALGEYACGSGHCAAIVQTTDYTDTATSLVWHTIFLPDAGATEALGLSTGTATVRFGNPDDGWIVASGRVLSTHDGGISWAPVNALGSKYVTTLEASKTKAFAVTADGSSLWVSTDVAGDSWQGLAGLHLPPAHGATDVADSLQLEQSTAVVVRTLGTTMTVRVSLDTGGHWRTVADPCRSASVLPLFSDIDEVTGRFVCGDGTTYEAAMGGGNAVRQSSLPPGALARAATVAHSITTDNLGSIAAYSGAGLIGSFDMGKTWSTVQPGSFGYVGMTDDFRGVALDDVPSSEIWLTIDGGSAWTALPFR